MKKTVKIEGMSCNHCTSRVTKSLQEIEGVSSVIVSLENKLATVEFTNQIPDITLKNSIEDLGFDVIEIY